MIRFFRKIRAALLEQKKIQKYLVYALGEIILVVIGILIALYLNAVRESNATEEQYRVQFRAVRAELFSNVVHIEDRFYHYKRMDSTRLDVLHNRPTFESVQDNPQDFSELTEIRYATLSQEAQMSLIGSNERLPAKYNSIMSMLRFLYRFEKSDLSSGVAKILRNNSNYLEHLSNKPWYHLRPNEQKNDSITHFMWNDYKFKNFLKLNLAISAEYKRDMQNYRLRALEAIEAIDELIPNEEKQSLSRNPFVDYSSFIGEYHLILLHEETVSEKDFSEPNIVRQNYNVVEQTGDRLITKVTNDSGETEYELLVLDNRTGMHAGYFLQLATNTSKEDTLFVYNIEGNSKPMGFLKIME